MKPFSLRSYHDSARGDRMRPFSLRSHHDAVRRRTTRRASLTGALAAALAWPLVLAGTATVAGAIERIDVSAEAPFRRPRTLTPEEQRLLRRAGDLRYDERLGIPTFVWTAPSAASEKSGRASRPPDAVSEARRHLSRVASLYDLTPADVAEARVGEVQSAAAGATIVKFHEEIGGIEVFREEVAVLMDRDLDRVAIAGFVSGAATRMAGASRLAFRLTPEEAVTVAVIDRTGDASLSAADLAGVGPSGEKYRRYDYRQASSRARSATLTRPARVKSVYFHHADAYEPSYYVEVAAEVLDVDGRLDDELVSYVISAQSGGVLFRNSLTARDVYTYRVWAKTGGEHLPLDSIYGDSGTPHPVGTVNSGYVPSFVAPSLVALQNGPISTDDPWLGPGATETRGNNVDAYADLASPDGFSPGDVRASVTSPGTFDRVYDPLLEPAADSTQIGASVTQAFYGANLLHDLFYDEGFDEAAGNGQDDNYGRGGIGGDRMRVEAQDYSGLNNADMSTPSDGDQPRMQLYLWSPALDANVTVNVQPGTPLLPTTITTVGVASFGASAFTTTGDVVVVDDGVGTGSDGCEGPFVNAAAIAGNIALVDRGDCNFSVKVDNAVAAGAVGVLIANNTGATTVIGMSGTCAVACPVGVIMVSQNQGDDIEAAILAGTVNVTMLRSADVLRDGALDGNLLAHEWGHFLSNRLIGDGNGLTSNQSRGMGEGWSDFTALLLTVEEGDSLSAVFPLVTYAAAGFGGDIPYFGLRRVPYSTDMTKNALTFGHIEDGVAISGAPCAFGCDGADNSEVHNTGEVWATILWECYASLLGDTLGGSPRLTFDEARQRMREYLVSSLKMTPVNPTFTEARDALLAVAGAGDADDATLFCEAFARRGLGQGAVAPSRFSSTNAGVVESFVCLPPPVCTPAPRGDCSIAPKGQVKFRGHAIDPSRQTMQWRWLLGSALLADFGDPVTGATSYRLCVYDDGALASEAAIGEAGICGGRPCWATKSSGLTYRNRTGNAEGINLVRFKPGSGKAQIQVKGKGSALGLPFPLTDATAVTVQMVTDPTSGSECWSSTFAAPASVNDSGTLKFQDKTP